MNVSQILIQAAGNVELEAIIFLFLFFNCVYIEFPRFRFFITNLLFIFREENEKRIEKYTNKWLLYEREYEKHPTAKEIRKYKLESANLDAEGTLRSTVFFCKNIAPTQPYFAVENGQFYIIATSNLRTTFRTLSNMFDGDFCENS